MKYEKKHVCCAGQTCFRHKTHQLFKSFKSLQHPHGTILPLSQPHPVGRSHVLPVVLTTPPLVATELGSLEAQIIYISLYCILQRIYVWGILANIVASRMRMHKLDCGSQLYGFFCSRATKAMCETLMFLWFTRLEGEDINHGGQETRVEGAKR